MKILEADLKFVDSETDHGVTVTHVPTGISKTICNRDNRHMNRLIATSLLEDAVKTHYWHEQCLGRMERDAQVKTGETA